MLGWMSSGKIVIGSNCLRVSGLVGGFEGDVEDGNFDGDVEDKLWRLRDLNSTLHLDLAPLLLNLALLMSC
jgi:hypothetical protein